LADGSGNRPYRRAASRQVSGRDASPFGRRSLGRGVEASAQHGCAKRLARRGPADGSGNRPYPTMQKNKPQDFSQGSF